MKNVLYLRGEDTVFELEISIYIYVYIALKTATGFFTRVLPWALARGHVRRRFTNKTTATCRRMGQTNPLGGAISTSGCSRQSTAAEVNIIDMNHI
jgi:hypothetical protein